MNRRQPILQPTQVSAFVERNIVMATPVPNQPLYRKRWDENGNENCKECETVTLWSTYYVDQNGESTTCTTTDYETTTMTSSNSQSQTLIPTQTYFTQYQTTTSTLYAPSTSLPSNTPSIIPAQDVQVIGQTCGCEKEWLQSLLGGVPNGVGEVIACIAFFIPFTIFFLLCAARLFKYSFQREIFFCLLPFLLFLALMVGFFPIRAFSATHNSTNHILAENFMIAIAVPILLDVALQVYALLRKRAQFTGWIDSSSMFLRLLNIASLVLYAIAAGDLVGFVKGWEDGTQTCSSNLLNTISTLNIVADFLELTILVLGFIFLFWARWRLRMNKAVLFIQAHIFLLFFIFFLWRTAHDISAASGWSKRSDKTCGPLCGAGDWSSSSSTKKRNTNTIPVDFTTIGGICTVSTNGIFYFFNYDWSKNQSESHQGINGQAAFWLLAILPIFLTTLLLMIVNLLVYTQAEPELEAMPDSARYKLCYNEDSKKMEFVRLDNVGGPILPDGQPLYEIVRGDDGEGWEIREAKTPTVLPAWQNVTVRPWYK